MRRQRLSLCLWVFIVCYHLSCAHQKSKKRKIGSIQLDNNGTVSSNNNNIQNITTTNDEIRKRYLIEVQDRQQAVKLANPIVDLEDSVRRGINDPLADPRFVMNKINDDYFGNRGIQGSTHTPELMNYHSSRPSVLRLGTHHLNNKYTPSPTQEEHAMKEEVVPKHPSSQLMPQSHISQSQLQQRQQLQRQQLQRQQLERQQLQMQQLQIGQHANPFLQPMNNQQSILGFQNQNQIIGMGRQPLSPMPDVALPAPSMINGFTIPNQLSSGFSGLNIQNPQQSALMARLNLQSQLTHQLSGSDQLTAGLQGLNVQDSRLLPVLNPQIQNSPPGPVLNMNGITRNPGLQGNQGLQNNQGLQGLSDQLAALNLPQQSPTNLQDVLLQSRLAQTMTDANGVSGLQSIPLQNSQTQLQQQHHNMLLQQQKIRNVPGEARSPDLDQSDDIDMNSLHRTKINSARLALEKLSRAHNLPDEARSPDNLPGESRSSDLEQSDDIDMNTLHRAKPNSARLALERLSARRKLLNELQQQQQQHAPSNQKQHLRQQKHLQKQHKPVSSLEGSINALTGLPDDLESQSFGTGVSSVTAVSDPVPQPKTVTIDTTTDDTSSSVADSEMKAEDKAAEEEAKEPGENSQPTNEQSTTGGGAGTSSDDSSFKSLKDYLEADDILRKKLGGDAGGGGGESAKNNDFSDDMSKAINVGDGYGGDKTPAIEGAKRSAIYNHPRVRVN